MSLLYFDYAATTPIDARVLASMLPFLSQQENFGNASSNHAFGRAAAHAIANASEQVAAFIHAKPQELTWTSGATEANNLAVKGVAYASQKNGKHIITTQIEHSSVLDTCKQLANEGFNITYLPVNKAGLIDLTQLAEAITADTILVSIMHVNNETGVVQNIAAISELLQKHKLYFHVDAAQSAGKVSIDLKQFKIDLMTFSAHKLYGPKGVGALYINQQSDVQLQPLLNGGGQQQGLRPGTLPVHQIVGMGAAFATAQQEYDQDNARIKHLRDSFWQNIQALGNVYLNGDLTCQVPHILNIAFADIDAKILLPALKDIALATGSACHENRTGTSHVLRAMGLTPSLINNSIRFSWGRFTSEDQIKLAIEKIKQAIKVLRQ